MLGHEATEAPRVKHICVNAHELVEKGHIAQSVAIGSWEPALTLLCILKSGPCHQLMLLAGVVDEGARTGQ